jgi:hypothetical protein
MNVIEANGLGKRYGGTRARQGLLGLNRVTTGERRAFSAGPLVRRSIK